MKNLNIIFFFIQILLIRFYRNAVIRAEIDINTYSLDFISKQSKRIKAT